MDPGGLRDGDHILCGRRPEQALFAERDRLRKDAADARQLPAIPAIRLEVAAQARPDTDRADHSERATFPAARARDEGQQYRRFAASDGQRRPAVLGEERAASGGLHRGDKARRHRRAQRHRDAQSRRSEPAARRRGPSRHGKPGRARLVPEPRPPVGEGFRLRVFGDAEGGCHSRKASRYRGILREDDPVRLFVPVLLRGRLRQGLPHLQPSADLLPARVFLPDCMSSELLPAAEVVRGQAEQLRAIQH